MLATAQEMVARQRARVIDLNAAQLVAPVLAAAAFLNKQSLWLHLCSKRRLVAIPELAHLGAFFAAPRIVGFARQFYAGNLLVHVAAAAPH